MPSKTKVSLVDEDFQAVIREFQPALLELFKGVSPQAYGAARRQLHVGARLNQTIRLKDVLRLLEGAGLLAPMLESSIPNSLSGRIVPDLAATLLLPSLESNGGFKAASS